MYSDRLLEFVLAKDAAATTTKALSLGQHDLMPRPGTTGTDGMGPYNGLFIYVGAGTAAIPAGLTINLQHADLRTGPWTTFKSIGPSQVIAQPGDRIFVDPVPFDVKNWIRFTLSSAVQLNIIMTRDVDKVFHSLRKS